MSENVAIENDAVEEQTNIVRETASAVADTAHKALRLSLGAADAAREEVGTRLEKIQEEVNELLNRFIERGETVESEGRKAIDGRRKQISEAIENRRQRVDEAVSEVSNDLDERIEAILTKMNVPTKDDIEALGKKITSLTRKVNALSKKEVA